MSDKKPKEGSLVRGGSAASGFKRLKGLMESTNHHMVLHDPSERSRAYMEEGERRLEARRRVGRLGVTPDGPTEGEIDDRKPLYEYTNVKRVSIREASQSSGKLHDEIRIELGCGRVMVVTGKHESIEVLDGRRGDTNVGTESKKLTAERKQLESEDAAGPMLSHDGFPMATVTCECGATFPMEFDALGFLDGITCGQCGESGQYTTS